MRITQIVRHKRNKESKNEVKERNFQSNEEIVRIYISERFFFAKDGYNISRECASRIGFAVSYFMKVEGPRPADDTLIMILRSYSRASNIVNFAIRGRRGRRGGDEVGRRGRRMVGRGIKRRQRESEISPIVRQGMIIG